LDETPSEEMRADLRRLRRLVKLMDRQFSIPGTRIRFGLDPLLGLLPIGGDLAGWFVSMCVIWKAAQLGVSRKTMSRMFQISAADVVFGYVPVLGDLVDVGFRANSRNLALAEAALLDGDAGGGAREQTPKTSRSVNAITVVSFSLLTFLLVLAPWLFAISLWDACR
jgi:hypothetical protein